MEITVETVKAALKEMEDAEMELDDMDYMTESPRLKAAMQKAEKFRDTLERFEEQQKRYRG